jgi:hypothetical protein
LQGLPHVERRWGAQGRPAGGGAHHTGEQHILLIELIRSIFCIDPKPRSFHII